MLEHLKTASSDKKKLFFSQSYQQFWCITLIPAEGKVTDVLRCCIILGVCLFKIPYLKDNFGMADFDKSRLDKRIRQMYGKHIPQSVIEKALRNKDILLNGLKAKASDRCSESDEIFIHPAICKMLANMHSVYPHRYQTRDYSEYISQFKSMIIYEDEDLIIVNKPEGLATQLGTKTKVALDVMAKAYHPEARLVHRIDKETSGIVVLVKSVEMSRYMLHMFQTRQVHKKYLSVVSGAIEAKKGTIDKPLIKRKEHVFIDLKDGKRR